MRRVLTERMNEAEQLLQELESWSEEEIEKLPHFYSEKARELRRLRKDGDE